MKRNKVKIYGNVTAPLFTSLSTIVRQATVYLNDAEMIALNDCLLKKGKHNPQALREFAQKAATKWHKKRINKEMRNVDGIDVEYQGVIPQR